jgi:hypothetical protein
MSDKYRMKPKIFDDHAAMVRDGIDLMKRVETVIDALSNNLADEAWDAARAVIRDLILQEELADRRSR